MGLVAKKLPLELTGMEVVHLTDSIRNTDYADVPQGKEEFVKVSRELLTTLASCYNELVHRDLTTDDGPVTVMVSEEEAWLLRTKVKTTDIGLDGKTFIGAGLLIKLYAMLMEFATPDLVPDLTSYSGSGSDGDRTFNNVDGNTIYMSGLYDSPRKETRDA